MNSYFDQQWDQQLAGRPQALAAFTSLSPAAQERIPRQLFTYLLAPRQLVVIAEAEIRTGRILVLQKQHHLVLIQVHLAHIAVHFVIVLVVGAEFAAAARLFGLSRHGCASLQLARGKAAIRMRCR